MKTIKYSLCAIMVWSVFCSAALAEESNVELMAGYHWLSPEKGEDWADASGVEIQARFWRNEHLGFALVGASDLWDARTEISEEDTGSTYLYSAVAGDASILSLGASLLYRSGMSKDVQFVMSAGLRYAMIDSSIYGEAAYDGPGGPSYLYEKIEIENALLFVVGAEWGFELTDDVSLLLGVGYQVDLTKPEETYAGESLGETGMDAISVSAALSCRM